MVKTGFVTLNAEDAEITVAECKRQGWLILRLPGFISSKDEFFEGVRRTLPLDPALQSNRSWDALADSLWAGLDSLKEDKILIVWPDSSYLKAHAPNDFSVATSILADLPVSLANPKMTAGPTKQLLILQKT